MPLGRPRWAWGPRDCGWNRQKWEAPLSLGFPVNLLTSVPLAADRNQPISSGQQQGSAIDQQAGSTLSFLPTHSPEAFGQGRACCLGRSCWASSSHRLLFCPPAKNTEDNLSAYHLIFQCEGLNLRSCLLLSPNSCPHASHGAHSTLTRGRRKLPPGGCQPRRFSGKG